MLRRTVVSALGCGLMLGGLSTHSASAFAEPWSDPDPRAGQERTEFGDYGFKLGAEYRTVGIYMNPIDLSGVKSRRASWAEHRARLDAAVDYREKVRFVLSMDVLDGTLWGDNGTFGGDPSPQSGTTVAAGIPNSARVGIGFRGGEDELDPDNYGYVLQSNDLALVRHAYGELNLPFGLVRIGRQPTTDGMNVLVSSGRTMANRFGYENRGDTIDRVLFATKPFEGFKPEQQRDRSQDRGFFLITLYDRVVGKEPHLFADDMHGVGVVARYLAPEPSKRRGFEIQGNYNHRWSGTYDTNVNIFGARAIAQLDKLTAGFEGNWLTGRTLEISEALALINTDPVVRQRINQWGARGVVRWDEPTWAAYLEVDYASGDRDPNPGSDLTQLVFAEDTNVGLLMFKRILHFESARSAAVGVELLKRLGASTFPAERTDSEGSFTNALALFPQFDFKPKDNLLFRGGVLMAWAPGGLVDPIQSLRFRDGVEVEDDLVNFHGGPPGNFYGVELDGRFQWRFEDHFYFDLEGAILFPGDALQDENGQAARSVLVQGRTTFLF
ncbi:MAG: hypothetical protein KIT72_07455 [Polyangiaceae bacterium]|nr:hypothetical protein [Polyangiaceae bacterium]MCW5790240.1 hypothetical protein [Polyangiaceae bacterium]